MNGKANRPIPPMTDKQLTRFWALVDRRGPTECWLWLGPKSAPNKASQQYGVFSLSEGRTESQYRPHRISWTLANGPIPAALDLDHVFPLCTTTLCCNPAHTEPVTTGVNVQRYYLSRTHCKRGHPIIEHGRPCNPCRALGKQRERIRAKEKPVVITDRPMAALIKESL